MPNYSQLAMQQGRVLSRQRSFGGSHLPCTPSFPRTLANEASRSHLDCRRQSRRYKWSRLATRRSNTLGMPVCRLRNQTHSRMLLLYYKSSVSIRRVAVCKANSGTTWADFSTLLTPEEVQQVAANRGLHLVVYTFGPFWRIVCREGTAEGRILGIVTGWIVPFTGILHCETLQVLTRGMKGEQGERVRGGALGLGLVLGGATFSFGYSQGCRKAEILAINDDETTHARLVRYYQYFGFKPVKVVEGVSLADLPDLLAFGGVGTRMDADVRVMLLKWGPTFRSKLRKARASQPGASKLKEERSAVEAGQ